MSVHLHPDPRRTNDALLKRRLIGLLACIIIALTTIGGASTVLAADLTVKQGESVRFYSGDATNVTVEPSGAGTVTVIPALPGVPLSAAIEFTASASFSGVATVRYDSVQLGTGVATTIQVEGTSANASGSFVPVAAPGPCLVITANAIVPFGDVTVGGGYKDTPAPPNVFGCAPQSVTQDILVQATNAQNGLINLAVDSCTQVATCAPGEGTYSVAILDAPLIVRSTPSVWLDARPGNAGAAPQLAVKMPATLAPTFVGSLFTFDVVFTAVAN